MKAGRIYLRPVDGTRGHVVVGISTEYLLRLSDAEERAFSRMIRPCSHAAYTNRARRWRALHTFYMACVQSWARMWGIER